MVGSRDLAGGQPVSEGRRKLCHGRFVDSAGNINERLMPDRVHPSPQGYAEWDACLNAAV